MVRALHRDGQPIDIHLSVNTMTLSDDIEGLVFVATFQDLTVLNNAMDAHQTALEVSRRHNSMTKVFQDTMPVWLLENLVDESADDLAKPKQELRRAHLHRHNDVCIAFFDIFGFSKYCASTPAEEVRVLYRPLCLNSNLLVTQKVHTLCLTFYWSHKRCIRLIFHDSPLI